MKYCAVSSVRKTGGRLGCAKPASFATSGQNSSTVRWARPPRVKIVTSPPAGVVGWRSAVGEGRGQRTLRQQHQHLVARNSHAQQPGQPRRGRGRLPRAGWPLQPNAPIGRGRDNGRLGWGQSGWWHGAYFSI